MPEKKKRRSKSSFRLLRGVEAESLEALLFKLENEDILNNVQIRRWARYEKEFASTYYGLVMKGKPRGGVILSTYILKDGCPHVVLVVDYLAVAEEWRGKGLEYVLLNDGLMRARKRLARNGYTVVSLRTYTETPESEEMYDQIFESIHNVGVEKKAFTHCAHTVEVDYCVHFAHS